MTRSKPKPQPGCRKAGSLRKCDAPRIYDAKAEAARRKQAIEEGFTEKLDSHKGYGPSTWRKALVQLDVEFYTIRTPRTHYLLAKPEDAKAARVLIVCERSEIPDIFDGC